MQFAMLPLQGVAQGAQPITSYNYGAKNNGRVKKTFRLLLTVSLTYSVALWTFVMLFPGVFVGIFTPDTALMEFAAPMLRIYFGGVCLFGIQIACQMTFTSLGKAADAITAAVAYLPHAPSFRRPDEGRLYGGARRRSHRGDIHSDPICLPLPKGGLFLTSARTCAAPLYQPAPHGEILENTRKHRQSRTMKIRESALD